MVDILAFGAHPDDLEFGCGGILAKAASQKKSIVMVDLTLGDKGTHGSPEIRYQEGMDAAKVINAKRIFLDFKDCEIIDSYEGRLKLVKVIREFRPKIVIAPMWKGGLNHPDHLACGVIVRSACRYARFAKILPELPPHRPGVLLHYLVWDPEKIDFIIDVSEQIEIWKQMMACHASQLQTFSYPEWVLKGAASLGTLINKPYAQGLIAGHPVIIDDLDCISQGIREI